MSVRLPRFEDVHPDWNAGTSYPVTNEEPEVFNQDILGKRTFKKAGGICSGGEIAFFTMLPRSEEVIVIDHSYTSLTAAFLKAVLLGQLGARELKRMCINVTWDEVNVKKEFDVAYAEALKTLPPPLVKYGPDRISSHDMREMRKVFRHVSLSVMRKAEQSLDRLTILHGDLLLDLPKFGPFDLFYMSNAQEHKGRSLKAFNLKDFSSAVNPGGLLLMAGYDATVSHLASTGWEAHKSVAGYRTSWHHRSFRRTDMVK